MRSAAPLAALLVVFALLTGGSAATGQGSRYHDAGGRVRVALVKQPFQPNGTSPGPTTMAGGGIQDMLRELGAVVRVTEIGLTPDEDTEYGGWKRLGMALGHFADEVAQNEREGWFTVGLLATCPSMPGLVAGLQHSGSTRDAIRVGMLWLDAPLADRFVVMGGIRETDPLEQHLLDQSSIEQLGVHDLTTASAAVRAQLDRLSRITDKIYVHIDMDVLDSREVMGHGNKVEGGPTSEDLAALFEMIFRDYPKASAVGFATIPQRDEGGLSLAALNRMIAAAVRGVKARVAGR